MLRIKMYESSEISKRKQNIYVMGEEFPLNRMAYREIADILTEKGVPKPENPTYELDRPEPIDVLLEEKLGQKAHLIPGYSFLYANRNMHLGSNAKNLCGMAAVLMVELIKFDIYYLLGNYLF